MTPLLDDILSVLALVAANIAIALILYSRPASRREPRMPPLLDGILSVLALVAANIAIALILYGFAPEITAWVTR